ncbi:MAG: hypothetical protein JWP13_539 [Candidatus Saccharibacteria bacterium]|nr:hypothetical protein [Candidatus Saccharibacteria bacterium]
MSTETNTAPTTPRKRSRKRKGLIALVVVLLVLGAGIYGAQRFLTGPSVGTAVSSLPAASRTTPIELEQFDGTTFSFVHPMTYMKQATKPAPNSVNLESHTFVSSGMTSKVLTATVSKLPSTKLEDDPSYSMRAQNPDRYKIKSVVLKNEKVMIATNSDGQQFQQTAFWVHGDKLLTFTMTGTATNTQAMTAEYQDMIGTISWH